MLHSVELVKIGYTCALSVHFLFVFVFLVADDFRPQLGMGTTEHGAGSIKGSEKASNRGDIPRLGSRDIERQPSEHNEFVSVDHLQEFAAIRHRRLQPTHAEAYKICQRV